MSNVCRHAAPEAGEDQAAENAQTPVQKENNAERGEEQAGHEGTPAQGGLPEEWEITASRVFEDALAYYDAQGDLEAILLVNEKLRDCGLSRENLRFYG